MNVGVKRCTTLMILDRTRQSILNSFSIKDGVTREQVATLQSQHPVVQIESELYLSASDEPTLFIHLQDGWILDVTQNESLSAHNALVRLFFSTKQQNQILACIGTNRFSLSYCDAAATCR